MDTELLVDIRIDDGRKLISRLVRDSFDVSVAFWVMTSEEELQFFYIGSKSVDKDRIGEAYAAVYASLRQIPNISISLSEIKLIHVSNPIAVDAIAIRDRHQARIPTRFRGKQLGNLSIEEAYIYPRASGTMDFNELMQTVVGLMNRNGPLQPSVITLKDGSEIHAIPHGLNAKLPGDIEIVILDTATNSDRVISINDVVNIQ